MSADWPELEKLIDAADASGVAAAVVNLDDMQRRALTGPLQEYAKRWLASNSTLDSDDGRAMERRGRMAGALRVAGAGCLVPASAVATWLGWAEQYEPYLYQDTLLRVVRARPLAWRQDLARRLAHDAPVVHGLAVVLVGETGVEPPATMDFALAWYRRVVSSRRGGSERRRKEWLADVLRDDPLLHEVPRLLFEPDDIGLHLSERSYGWASWPSALAELTAEGRLDRAAILDACLGRLLRGGTASQLRAYRQIYQALQITLDEAAGRVRDLVTLLAGAPSPMALAAQADLRRLDKARRLATDALAEASRAALLRPEKKLAATQLSWLRTAIRQQPDRAAKLLPVLTVALGHARPEIQQKAVELLAKYRQHCPPAVRPGFR